MGDHATRKDASSNEPTRAGAPTEAFWADAVQGITQPLIDPRVPGTTADANAMLPWVDDDHHASVIADIAHQWGGLAHQEELERRQKKTRPKPRASDPSPASDRLADIPTAYGIEEQVVGSTHRFVVARPRVTGPLTAVITPSIRSADRSHGFTPRLSTAGFLTLDSNNPTEIAIQFEPQHTGQVAADLVLKLHWSDGSVETRTVALSAKARLRTEIPESLVPVSPNDQFREAAEFGAPASSPSPSPKQPDDRTREFDKLVTDTKTAAERLNDRQVDGVNTASAEAASYSRMAPDTSLFYDLMELAISMGIAGVAGVIARKLGTTLAAKLGRDEKSGLALGLIDGVKDGIKRIGNSATVKSHTVEHIPGGPRHHDSDDAIQSENKKVSTNGRIAFFSSQVEMLRDLIDENDALVDEQAAKLEPLLAKDPDSAIAAMRALKEAFNHAKEGDAQGVQADASSMQWVAAVARGSLGSVTAQTHDGSFRRKVSNMTEYDALKDGVLIVGVERSDAGFGVTRASIRGVSQEIVNRLAPLPLQDVLVPIRLELGTAVIHLDEARRMRVTGLIDADDALPISEYVQQQNMPQQFEAQATRRAETIARLVLSKSLAEWGIDEIASDDATRTGDAK